MFVVAAYVAAETVRPEAGLFATTAMGVILANQRWVSVRNLRIFGDPIVSLLIGSLFIVLASRVEPGSILDHLPATLVLVAFLVLVVRPLVVFLCTLRCGPVAPGNGPSWPAWPHADRGGRLPPPSTGCAWASSASPARCSSRSPSR